MSKGKIISDVSDSTPARKLKQKEVKGPLLHLRRAKKNLTKLNAETVFLLDPSEREELLVGLITITEYLTFLGDDVEKLISADAAGAPRVGGVPFLGVPPRKEVEKRKVLEMMMRDENVNNNVQSLKENNHVFR